MLNSLGFAVLVTLMGASLEDNPIINASEGSNCKGDNKAVQLCQKCSQLPFNTVTTFSSCCSDESAMLFCDACVNNEDSCKVLIKEIDEVNEFSEDESDYDTDYDKSESFDNYDDAGINEAQMLPFNIKSVPDKRYGRLFVKPNPKRYGRVFFGKRSGQDSDDQYGDIDKRYGRLYVGSGSYFGKRDDMDKRYGQLFMNGGYFGKRSNPYKEELDTDFEGYDSDAMQYEKRFGRVFLGDGNRMFGGRNFFGASDFSKRYGQLFMGKSKLFGKRSADFDDDTFNSIMDKRYGQLFLGNNRRLPWRYDYRSKRYGRLFTNRGKHYFG